MLSKQYGQSRNEKLYINRSPALLWLSVVLLNMNHKTSLIELHYLPSIEFFTCLLRYDSIQIEAHENFQKQSYRNRCYIKASNGVHPLIVPVLKGGRMPIRSVKIDYSQRWINDHWRTLSSAYGKAPFFEHYADYFHDVLFRRPDFLFDLNWELLTLCLRLLDLRVELSLSCEYLSVPREGVQDLRNVVHPKKPYKNNSFYQTHMYHQIFGKDFVENLSVIDLLFCEGTNAKLVVTKSVFQE